MSEVTQANKAPSNTSVNKAAKAMTKEEEAKAIATATKYRTQIFITMYPRDESNNYPYFFEIQRLVGRKDTKFSENLLNLYNKLVEEHKRNTNNGFDRYMFNFIDLLYKSYINAGPRLPHVHDLSLIETASQPRLCDVCDVKFSVVNQPQKNLYKYYTCNDCNYDECLKCYRKSDREKHEHTLIHTGWARRANEYNCNTCGRFADGGKCWECEECKKEGKTYVECDVCHSEPTKDQTVFPNILDGINISVTNKNKTSKLVVRPAYTNLPAGGKRRHTKRNRN